MSDKDPLGLFSKKPTQSQDPLGLFEQKKNESFEPSFQKAERERKETPTQIPYKTAEQLNKETPISQPKQKSYAQSFTEGVVGSTINLAAGVQNLPKLLNAYKDKGSDYVGKLLGKALGASDDEINQFNKLRKTPDAISELSRLAEESKQGVDLGKVSREYSQVTSEEDQAMNKGKSLVGLVREGEINKAGKKVTKYLGQALPTVAGFVFAPQAALPASASITAANTYDELQSDPKYAGLDDGTKLMVATAHGGIDYAFNKYAGDIGIGKEVNKILLGGKEVTRAVAEEVLKKTFVDVAKKTLSKASPIKTATYNYLGAVGQQFANNLIDKATIDPEKDLEEGVWEAGEGAIAVGGALLGLQAASSIKNRKIRDEVKALEATRNDITNDIDNAEIPDAQKELLQGKVEKINERITNLAKKDDIDAEYISDELKDKIYENNAKIEEQEAILNNSKLSDATRELAVKDIEKLQKKSEALSEEATRFDEKQFDELSTKFDEIINKGEAKNIQEAITRLVDLGTIERIC